MAKKREYSWMGGGVNHLAEPDGATSTSEIIRLIPPLPVGDLAGARTTFLIDAMYLHFSIRRKGANAISPISALGFLVWQAAVTETTDVPVQSLDALSLQDRLYANKQIMMMAPLPVPPILAASDLATAIQNESVLVAHHEYQAQRKHDRANQVLAMTVNCDLGVAIEVFCQWRVLVSWSR